MQRRSITSRRVERYLMVENTHAPRKFAARVVCRFNIDLAGTTVSTTHDAGRAVQPIVIQRPVVG